MKNITSSFTELWAERQRVVAAIERLAQVSMPTEQDRAEEARLASALTEIDGQITRVAPRVDQLVSQRASDLQRLASRATTTMTAAETEFDQDVRSYIAENNPKPITLMPESAPPLVSRPGMELRSQYEQRAAILTSTATQALPRDVYGRFIMSLVESTAVLRAGATLVQTATGNELLVPRLTGYSTAALVAEGQTITQSEPTLDVLSLGAYKYGVTFQISREMADDSPLALQDVLFRNAAQALVSAYGPKLILGNGTTEPQGLVTAGTVGKQGPAGTSTSLGTQGTAGQGTDFVADMEASVNDAYIMRGPVWLMNNTSRTAFRKLQDGQKRPIYDLRPNVPGASADVDGYPLYVEPGFANMGISAKFAAFGDPSVYIVRIVNGIRFERSDEFAFTSDLVTFKAVARLDAGLADTAGLKIMQNAAS